MFPLSRRSVDQRSLVGRKVLRSSLAVLEEVFGISSTVKLKEKVISMCNVSECIESRGIEKGIEKGIDKLAELMRWLKSQNRFAEALDVADDPVLRDKLFEEMALSKAN